MYNIMVRNLPPGVRFHAVFDSCHSGTALDLPYQYHPDGRLKERTLQGVVGSSLKDITTSLTTRNIFGASKQLMQGLNRVMNIEKTQRPVQSTMADVISFSGCKDGQTSADTRVNGKHYTNLPDY
jgi:hypothetical protein